MKRHSLRLLLAALGVIAIAATHQPNLGSGTRVVVPEGKNPSIACGDHCWTSDEDATGTSDNPAI